MDDEICRSPWPIAFRTVALGIAMMALLTLVGCATPPETVVEVVERRVEIPRSLLTCSPEPVAGSVWISQRDVAKYMVDLAEAGADCRAKLDAVRRLVDAEG